MAIQNARLTDIRVVVDLYRDGVPGFCSSQYVVRADSAIKTIEDLKGKTIATNGPGGAIDMAMRKMLRTHGLEDKRGDKVSEVKAGRVRSLFTIKDAMGVAQTTLLAARTPFIAKNRDVLLDFSRTCRSAHAGC